MSEWKPIAAAGPLAAAAGADVFRITGEPGRPVWKERIKSL